MRIAVWQGPSPAADLENGLSQAEAALSAAGNMSASVLVLPEIWLPGYNQPDIPSRSLAADSAELARLSAAARAARCALVIGYAEQAEGRLYNAALCLGPDGTPLANYRKIQLYGPREQALYSPGTGYVTFDLAGQTLALLICYDIEFAPHIKALAAQGVSLILCPTANMHPFIHVPRVTVPAMAASHGLAIAYANYCGTEGNLTYTGGSQIIGPHGEILALAGEHPALLIADLPARDPARLSTQSADFRTV
ncbi:nitrilase-related carbon-nitrogen hydrolase [Pseudotabrizicola alkalilacus]|uniref:Nitrilase n=1 Tax=Pseudotabrizicola alkalilacus TaxID=2305252 RepID=A0A411YXZ9_9RHOB|nr:nitrilase-related carbon-nitrogen hydrolase [Pseudotabrizicola alkalilacus]RGP35774.1 nitrilase [Pseudotabrizicola alkalilacus]